MKRPSARLAALVAALVVGRSALVAADEPRALPAPRLSNKVHSLIDEILKPEVELTVEMRKSKIVRLKKPVFRIAVADPTYVETVAFGSREIEFIGRETGSTSVTLWLGNETNAETLSLVVTVVPDREVDEQRRLQYGELQLMVNELFPNSKVQLIPIANKLIVRGQAADEQEASRIIAVVQQNYAGNGGGGGAGGGGFGAVAQGTAAEPFPDGGDLPASTIIPMLRTPGVKQVLLKVRIAEVQRTALRNLGADFNFRAGDFLLQSVLSGGGNVFASGTFSDGDFFNLTLNVLASRGYAKILAEPNLVVLSGQSASFLSGGEFAVPTVVGVGGAQAATTQFQAFGTQLQFTPQVIDHDRIRLQVTPTFSTINSVNAVQGIPGLDTRTASTTVELREGQVFAIAGLLQEQQAGQESWIPGLGDIKVLKPLLQNKSVNRSETELLIVVTPELVQPLEPENAPQLLPGMEITEPGDVDFFLYGNIEGRSGVHHRSTVWNAYKNRARCCRDLGAPCFIESDQYYISGPSGFSN